MEVLVTGGTGFVGRDVVRQLHAAGHRIRILVRRPDSPVVRALGALFDARPCVGNVLDPAALPAALAGAGAVIHLVGIISEFGRNTFENAHTCATANVIAAARQAGARRYLQMSALGTRPGAASRYHQTKWAAEEAVRGSGLAWTILRPSLIYGPEDHFVNLFARMSRWSPFLPVMGAGRGRLQPVSVEATAECFVRSLTEPRCEGQTLDVCGRDRLTFVELLRTILSVLGRRRLLVHLPLPLARLQARVFEFIFPSLLGRAAPLNRDQLLMLQEDNVGDPGPAAALFGLAPERFRDGISRFLLNR
jgi:NADH dehydrogenase